MSEIKLICGNCVFYIGKQDRHGAEGACTCMPPSVAGLPAMNLARQPVIQWVTAPRPAVKEDHYCGQWQPREQVLPAVPKVLEN